MIPTSRPPDPDGEFDGERCACAGGDSIVCARRLLRLLKLLLSVLVSLATLARLLVELL